MNNFYFLEQADDIEGIKEVYPGLYIQIAETVSISSEATLIFLNKNIYFQKEKSSDYEHFKAIEEKNDSYTFPVDFLVKLSYIFPEDHFSTNQIEALTVLIIDSYMKCEYEKMKLEDFPEQQEHISHFFDFLYKLEPAVTYSFFTSLYAKFKNKEDLNFFLETSQIKAPCLTYSCFFHQHFSNKRKDIETKFNKYYQWLNTFAAKSKEEYIMYWVYFPFTYHINFNSMKSNNIYIHRMDNTHNISMMQLGILPRPKDPISNMHLPSLLRDEGDLLKFKDIHPYYSFETDDDQKIFNFAERNICSSYPISSLITRQKNRDFRRVINLIDNNKFLINNINSNNILKKNLPNILNNEEAVKKIEAVFNSIDNYKLRKDNSFLMDCLIFGASIVASKDDLFSVQTPDFEKVLTDLKGKKDINEEPSVGDANKTIVKIANSSEGEGKPTGKGPAKGPKSSLIKKAVTLTPTATNQVKGKPQSTNPPKKKKVTKKKKQDNKTKPK